MRRARCIPTCIRKRANVCPPFPQQCIRLLSRTRLHTTVCTVYSGAYTAAERRIECVTRATISRHASHNFRGRPVISSLPICRTYYPVIMPVNARQSICHRRIDPIICPACPLLWPRDRGSFCNRRL
ncbi:hypothetical protein PUN28_003235 [Cardiocondyla obscurior]|uniref:Uncharacterized protein n=1 Tax=Cardiocondyla obscurior TaxID=286306 RepID=A0AAW2GIM4_9HYME